MGWLVTLGTTDKKRGKALGGVTVYLDEVEKATQENGVAEYNVTTRQHTYRVITPVGYVFVHGARHFLDDIPIEGSFEIPEGWPEDSPASPFSLVFEFNEGELTPEEEERGNLIGKVGALAATVAIGGIILNSK